MTANPIPGLSLPGLRDTTDHGIQRNFQQILQWSQGVSPLLYAWGANATPSFPGGPAKPPSNAYLIQFSTDLISFDSSGEGQITFPQTFPNGVGNIQLTLAEGYTGACLCYAATGITTSGLVAVLSTGAGSPITGGHSISWYVVGF